MSKSNSTLISEIRTIAENNKAISFIHSHEKSLSVEVINRGYHNKIDLTKACANSKLIACHLTLQLVDDGLQDYQVQFAPKNKKMFTLQYDVSAKNRTHAEELATRDLVDDRISRHDYKPQVQIKLINSVGSAA